MSKIETIIKYLLDMELENNFIPWDNDEHAIKNIMTVFNILETDARIIVKGLHLSIKREDI